MIPQTILEHLKESYNLKKSAFNTVSGGCINSCFKIETNLGVLFLKWNNASRYPSMFEKEVMGLQLMAKHSSFTIPNVQYHGEVGDYSWLVMEYVDTGKQQPNYWQKLGEQLAEMHQHTHEVYGLDYNNYIGSLNQSNQYHKNWVEFYRNERIEPQIKLAVNSGKLDVNISNSFSKLCQQLPGIFPDEKPALLHGDLWSGNLMIDRIGNPCLVDPAVYYGHREMELAFTQLFGGFDNTFYNAYHENFPLAPGFQERVPIYNLYPLLVHVNLFGGGYANQVIHILRNYS